MIVHALNIASATAVAVVRGLFGTIFTARRYDSAVYAVIVCLSVCPSIHLSIRSRYCTKTAKHRITQIRRPDSAANLVFWCQRCRRKPDYEGGNKQVWWVEIGDFRPISRYISEMVQDGDIVSMEGD